MSESDDWENAVDDIVEDKKEETKQEEGKFEDEDNVDSDDERKKAAEEAKAKRKAEADAPKRVKTSKKDYEQMYAKNKGLVGQGAQKAAQLAQNGKAGEAVSRAAEEDITDQLFQQDLGTEASGLNSEQNYVKFAQQVGDVLYEGQSPYHIPAFFGELAKGLGSTNLEAIDMKKIVDAVTVAYNAKVAEEKKRDGGKKKGKEKPKI